MPIRRDPNLEASLRARAEAGGLTEDACVERMVSTEQAAEEKLEALALEGLNSGAAIEAGTGYWEEKHRRLEERLKLSGGR
jgi:hypothetical protein